MLPESLQCLQTAEKKLMFIYFLQDTTDDGKPVVHNTRLCVLCEGLERAD